jgi:hypothetical protein
MMPKVSSSMGVFVPACLAVIVASVALGAGAATPAKSKAPAAKARAAKAPARPAKAATPAPRPTTIIYVMRRTEDSWSLLNPSAIETVPGGNVRRAYTVTVRRNLLNGGPPQPGYVRTLHEFDCAEYKFRWRTFTVFNRFGVAVIKQDNPDAAFVPMNRGSEEQSTFRTVCDGAEGGSVVAAPSMGQLVIGLMQAWDEAAMAAPLQALSPAKPGAAKPDAGRPAVKPADPPPKTPAPKASDPKSAAAVPERAG